MATTATPLPQSERYANYDNTEVVFCPAIANMSAPTRAEITAGTDLTGEISDISGFTVTGGEIEAPDLKSEFVSKVPGRTSAEDSSLTFYADRGGDDVRAMLPYKTAGFLVFFDGGDQTGQTCDVFPVRVRNGGGKTRSTGDELAKIMIAFSITREPALDVPVPATV